ncbi:hypothetical protein KAX97_11960 [candidate division WOR-3 bacterium]|nr:hypothetical protein [candidate division WOR-3 bacterium]
MININNKQVKLCLLDTNVLSELLKNKKPYLKRLCALYPFSDYVHCYSAFSITEIKRISYLYEKYLDVFSLIPSLIMNGHEAIFQEELKHYVDRNHEIKSWAIAPFAIKSRRQMSPRHKLRYVLSQRDIMEKEKHWLASCNETLTGILSLKENYLPEGRKYTKKEITNFVDIVTTTQIILRARDFVQQSLNDGKAVDINLFPSIKSTIYMVFYKFYPDNRKPKKSDVFDIIICSLLPYVDAFITDSHQSEVINKIKRVDNLLNHLDNRSIKSIL